MRSLINRYRNIDTSMIAPPGHTHDRNVDGARSDSEGVTLYYNAQLSEILCAIHLRSGWSQTF